MVKIAVCDDDPDHLRSISALLEDYLSTHPHHPGRTHLFDSGQSLLDHAQALGGFDLYLLDILMPGLNGIQTGEQLRSLGAGGEIIYLSSSKDYAVDSYQVGAFFYLLKPVDRERLFQVLDGALDKLRQRDSQVILVTTPQGTRRVLLDQILYVERVNRAMRYYCLDGIVDSQHLRASFREAAAPLLAHPRFCLCGASFVLNLQHVVEVSGQRVLLDNNTSLILPRTAAAPFKLAWGSYWLGGGGQ